MAWPFREEESPPVLPARARAVLDEVRDPAGRERLSRVLGAVADALEEIAALDVLRRELPRGPAEVRELFLEARPAAARCIGAARALVLTVNHAYPEPEQDDAGFDLGGDEARPDPPRSADPADGARACAWAIDHECERMQSSLMEPVPASPEEAWSRLVELQEFRGKLRAGVEELLFQVCAMRAEVAREEVIPGYRERLFAALDLRRGIARSGRRLLPLCEKVKSAGGERVGAAVEEVAAAFESLCASPVYPALRMTDRRLADGFREKLARLGRRSGRPDAQAAAEVAEDLARFLEGLAAISNREVLKLHDAEAVADLHRYAAAAERDQVRAPHRAQAEFFLAERVARRLEGVDPALDAYLEEAASWPEGRPPEGPARGAARLRALLEAMAPGAPLPPADDADDEPTTPGAGPA